MTVPEGLIGLALVPHQALVEAGPLRLFAKATGETNLVGSTRRQMRMSSEPPWTETPLLGTVSQVGRPLICSLPRIGSAWPGAM